MTKKAKRIILLSFTGVLVVLLIVAITLTVKEVNRNPLLGKWVSDDKKLSYSFFEDASVKAEFSDCKLPVLETKYTGTFDGAYAYDKSTKELSVTLNIYSKKITVRYTYETDENTVILTNTSDDKKTSFNLASEALSN